MRETILNAYTTALLEGNSKMANQIRPYVMLGFLDRKMDEDVMEYILANGVNPIGDLEEQKIESKPDDKVY